MTLFALPVNDPSSSTIVVNLRSSRVQQNRDDNGATAVVKPAKMNSRVAVAAHKAVSGGLRQRAQRQLRVLRHLHDEARLSHHITRSV
jgi:hypothetical protein